MSESLSPTETELENLTDDAPEGNSPLSSQWNRDQETFYDFITRMQAEGKVKTSEPVEPYHPKFLDQDSTPLTVEDSLENLTDQEPPRHPQENGRIEELYLKEEDRPFDLPEGATIKHARTNTGSDVLRLTESTSGKLDMFVGRPGSEQSLSGMIQAEVGNKGIKSESQYDRAAEDLANLERVIQELQNSDRVVSWSTNKDGEYSHATIYHKYGEFVYTAIYEIHTPQKEDTEDQKGADEVAIEDLIVSNPVDNREFDEIAENDDDLDPTQRVDSPLIRILTAEQVEAPKNSATNTEETSKESVANGVIVEAPILKFEAITPEIVQNELLEKTPEKISEKVQEKLTTKGPADKFTAIAMETGISIIEETITEQASALSNERVPITIESEPIKLAAEIAEQKSITLVEISSGKPTSVEIRTEFVLQDTKQQELTQPEIKTRVVEAENETTPKTITKETVLEIQNTAHQEMQQATVQFEKAQTVVTQAELTTIYKEPSQETAAPQIVEDVIVPVALETIVQLSDVVAETTQAVIEPVETVTEKVPTFVEPTVTLTEAPLVNETGEIEQREALLTKAPIAQPTKITTKTIEGTARIVRPEVLESRPRTVETARTAQTIRPTAERVQPRTEILGRTESVGRTEILGAQQSTVREVIYRREQQAQLQAEAIKQVQEAVKALSEWREAASRNERAEGPGPISAMATRGNLNIQQDDTERSPLNPAAEITDEELALAA